MSSAGEGLQGFYTALENLGSSPQEVIERMAIRNLLLDYALAKRFSVTVRVEDTIDGLGTFYPRRNGVQELGVDYLEISDPATYTFAVVDSPTMVLFVVGIDTTTGQAAIYDLGQRGTVDTRAYDYAYLLVLNTSTHLDPDDCQYTSWEINVTDGSNAALTPADSEIWSAAQFIVPN